jgi:hypothetical protein
MKTEAPGLRRRLVEQYPDRTKDIPTMSIEQWREKYADLLTPVTFQELWGRKDEPDYAALRKRGFDGEGVLVLGQVQIARDSGSLRKIPAWMNHKTAVREFLLAHFPRLVADADGQRHTAAKWLYIIEHLRNLDSAEQIARKWNASILNMTGEELLDALFGDGAPVHPLDAAQVRSTVQKILFVAGGLRTDGKARNGKRGRPKGKL